MISFQAGTKSQKKTVKRERKVPGLESVPGVRVGLAIEWASGNTASELTPAEVESIKRNTGVKRLNIFRAIQIKNLMHTRTDAQMAKQLRCSPRTVWGIRTALLKSRGGAK
jgi:hypothetical protein